MASGAHQKPSRKFAESSPKTIVDLHKAEVQMKKRIDSLEHQQNTAVTNIANHQQVMKMSWRRLEEKRTSSPQTGDNRKKEDAKKAKKGMLLQSHTKLYVDTTPEIYNVGSHPARPTTADDSTLGRTTPAPGNQGYYLKTKPKQGPPPTQITRSYTSPYISSPVNFRRKSRPQEPAESREQNGSDPQLSKEDSQEFLSSSQPMLIKKSTINDKETLLKASNFMDMQSSSNGPGGFKTFYSDRPRSQGGRTLSPLVTKQMQLEEILAVDDDPEEDEVDEVGASNSMPTLAEQFEQIKGCKYIRHSKHYHPERAALDEY